MPTDHKVFVIKQLSRCDDMSMAQLIVAARQHGLDEGDLRKATERLLERGEVRLTRAMRLALAHSISAC